MLAGPLYLFDLRFMIAEAFPHGCFQPNVSYPLQDELLELIRATPIALVSSNVDSFTWKGSSNGTFSATTAYHIAKGNNEYLDDDISFFQWLKSNYTKTGNSPAMSIQWGTLFTFALWTIRVQRNQKVYRSNAFDTNHNITIIKERVMEFVSTIPRSTAKKPTEICHVRLDKPPEGYFKLNTDGSALKNLGPAAYGGLIRDTLGKWVVGFTRNIGITSVLGAEF
ncbi:hypothetical protein SLE2022_158310 [Rubroshorea leprosula]